MLQRQLEFFLKNISPNGSQLEIDDLLKIFPGLRKALILQWTKFLAFIGSINKMIHVPIHNQTRFLNYKDFRRSCESPDSRQKMKSLFTETLMLEQRPIYFISLNDKPQKTIELHPNLHNCKRKEFYLKFSTQTNNYSFLYFFNRMNGLVYTEALTLKTVN